MDVVETNDEVLCHLEVPGLTTDDIDIRVQDNMLVVSGEKKAATEEQKEGGFRSIERRYGRFERSVGNQQRLLGQHVLDEQGQQHEADPRGCPSVAAVADIRGFASWPNEP